MTIYRERAVTNFRKNVAVEGQISEKEASVLCHPLKGFSKPNCYTSLSPQSVKCLRVSKYTAVNFRGASYRWTLKFNIYLMNTSNFQDYCSFKCPENYFLKHIIFRLFEFCHIFLTFQNLLCSFKSFKFLLHFKLSNAKPILNERKNSAFLQYSSVYNKWGGGLSLL